MKTNRLINQKYYLEEELTLSPADIQLAIQEFIENRFIKFQNGWQISPEIPVELKVTCSKWVGFTCGKCHSVMTSKGCRSQDCQNFVCDNRSEISKCCRCLGI